MAFNRQNLGLADAGMNTSLPRTWSYTTTDATATVDTAGYFNGAADLLAIGDNIIAITSSGGTPSYERYFVNANAAGVVDVADSVALDGASDTD